MNSQRTIVYFVLVILINGCVASKNERDALNQAAHFTNADHLKQQVVEPIYYLFKGLCQSYMENKRWPGGSSHSERGVFEWLDANVEGEFLDIQFKLKTLPNHAAFDVFPINNHKDKFTYTLINPSEKPALELKLDYQCPAIEIDSNIQNNFNYDAKVISQIVDGLKPLADQIHSLDSHSPSGDMPIDWNAVIQPVLCALFKIEPVACTR